MGADRPLDHTRLPRSRKRADAGRDFQAMEKRRRRGADLFEQDRAEIAGRVGVGHYRRVGLAHVVQLA